MIAGSMTLVGMTALGAFFVMTEPETRLPELLEGTSFAQQFFFLSREGFFIWRLTIDPDHQQLYLLDWVVRNLVIILGLILLAVGLWAERLGLRPAFRAYAFGGTGAAFFLPYLYRVATGAKPWFHIIIDAFNPHYVAASAPLALAGGFFGLAFFALRRAAIRRRLI